MVGRKFRDTKLSSSNSQLAASPCQSKPCLTRAEVGSAVARHV